MAINKIDARHRIKRSILPGIIPTVPPSTDFTDGTWLNTDIRAAELFFNIPDQKLWIGTDTGSIEIPLIGGTTPTLSQVLNADNETGAFDITITDNQAIKSSNFLTSLDAGGQLNLDYGGTPGAVLLSVDLGAYDKGQLYMEPGYIELSSYATGSVINLFTNNKGIQLKDTLTEFLLYSNDSDIKFQADGLRLKSKYNGSLIDDVIIIADNFGIGIQSSAAGDKPGIIIGSKDSTINSAVTNSVILGGNTIVASTSNSVYVPDLIIQDNKSIKSSNGSGQLDLDYFGSPGEVSLSTDAGGQSESYIYMTPNSTDLVGGDGGSIGLAGDVTINAATSNRVYIRGGITGFLVEGRYNSSGSGDIITFKDNFGSSLTTSNNVKPGIIIGSQNSTINSAITNSVIIGGSSNTIGSSNALILGGSGNTLESPGSIMSGVSNTDSAQINNITSGHSNINNTNNSLLVGYGNTMSNPGIMYSNVNTAGTNDIGSNGFSSVGERTTNATPKDLSPVGQSAANQFLVSSNIAYRVHLTLLATDVATGDCKEWEGFGIIKNVAGTTSLVGAGITLNSTIADVSLATATVAVTADDPNDALKVTVTGIAATTINWICGIKYDKIIIA